MSIRSFATIFAVFIVLVVGAQSVYIVTEIERGVVLRFGKVVNPDVGNGLHFKLPFVDQVRRFDARVLTLDSRPERFLTVEKKAARVDSFAKWRIIDVARYYTATNGEQDLAERLLAQRFNESLRNHFAIRSLQEVVSGERDLMLLDIRNQLNSFTQDTLGVEVVDIRMKRIDLPEEVSEPVFNRMRAERDREAKEHRAIGREQAEITRAEADREVIVIEANAYSESERIRGEGDALAAAIYASAHTLDADFYSFMRSLNAYRNTFAGREDLILMDPKSNFFRFFNEIDGQIEGQ